MNEIECHRHLSVEGGKGKLQQYNKSIAHKYLVVLSAQMKHFEEKDEACAH